MSVPLQNASDDFKPRISLNKHKNVPAKYMCRVGPFHGYGRTERAAYVACFECAVKAAKLYRRKACLAAGSEARLNRGVDSEGRAQLAHKV